MNETWNKSHKARRGLCTFPFDMPHLGKGFMKLAFMGPDNFPARARSLLKIEKQPPVKIKCVKLVK